MPLGGSHLCAETELPPTAPGPLYRLVADKTGFQSCDHCVGGHMIADAFCPTGVPNYLRGTSVDGMELKVCFFIYLFYTIDGTKYL